METRGPPRNPTEGERPYTLGETLADIKNDGKPRSPLRAQLEKMFGLGEHPAKRRALYLRLDRLCELDRIYLSIILECIAAADTKENPSHWFCRSITKRIADYQTQKVRSEMTAWLDQQKGKKP